ncbi:MAG: tetratricopeptide repeat protein [Myxococcota bacterium]|nr:tetratricopeptide repeat protein [Myxococcota bacterium]
MTTRQPFVAMLLLGVAFFATSCFFFTSKKEGRALRADVDHLNDRMAQMESELDEERQHLTDMIDRARTDVEKLEETLNRATRILARNNADFGADMEKVKDRLREIDGSFAEIQYDITSTGKALEAAQKRIDGYARAAGVDLPVETSQIPDSPTDHLKAIRDAYSAQRYGEARSLSKVFLGRHSDHRDADDVQLIIAKSYIDQRRWAKALGVLRQFTDKFPKSDLTPEVLYHMARSFFALGDCTDARIIVDAIKSRYRRNPFAKKAQALGNEMRKNKSLCTS